MDSDYQPSSPSFKSSPSSWIKSKAVDLPEEIKERLSTFVSKILAGGGRSSRRSSRASEFRYDPASYALNFEDEAARIDDICLRSFSARLPMSPPRKRKARSEIRFPAAESRRITACG